MTFSRNDGADPIEAAAYLLSTIDIDFVEMVPTRLDLGELTGEEVARIKDLCNLPGNQYFRLHQDGSRYHMTVEPAKRGRKPLPETAKRIQVSITISPETDRWLRQQTTADRGIGHIIDELVALACQPDDPSRET
jgi:hypothetical protein